MMRKNKTKLRKESADGQQVSSMTLLELLELVRRMGEEFEVGKYHADLVRLLASVANRVEELKEELPSLEHDRKEIKTYLPGLASLNSNGFLYLGGHVCGLELHAQEIENVFDGLGVVAVGKSLILSPDSPLTLAYIADLADCNTRKVLDRPGIKKIYEQALSRAGGYVDLTNALEHKLEVFDENH